MRPGLDRSRLDTVVCTCSGRSDAGRRIKFARRKSLLILRTLSYFKKFKLFEKVGRPGGEERRVRGRRKKEEEGRRGGEQEENGKSSDHFLSG